MAALLRSVALFGWGVVRRFYFWLPAVLLDPFDIYEKYIRARLPAEWQRDINMPSEAFPYVLGLGLVWSAVLTYHELRQRIGRDPKVPQKLQGFYIAAESIVNRRLEDASEYSALIAEAQAWAGGAGKWIKENMGDAALSRFRDRRNILPISHNRAVSTEHSDLINVLMKYRENLQSLIESDAWDKPRK